MTGFEIKGWCPGAHRPMMSDDGLIVRVRLQLGRLTKGQAEALATAAKRYGNGRIDLSARANLQIRGVSPEAHAPLLSELAELGLLDANAETEARRNILVSPFSRRGDDTEAIAAVLTAALTASDLELPGKFGFAIDCGPERVLAEASADIRIERGASGGLILRADGADRGRAVERETASAEALALARWFIQSGGVHEGRGRMRAHLARGAKLPDELAGTELPAREAAPPRPGPCSDGALVALPFGELTPAQLKQLAELGSELRPTPWRMIFLPGVSSLPAVAGLMATPDDPLLRVEACTGAPGCPQAMGETRHLARALAPLVPAGSRLHVSGCAKGCAHPQALPIVVVATAAGYDLVRNGTASDAPLRRGLSAVALAASPELLSGSG